MIFGDSNDIISSGSYTIRECGSEAIDIASTISTLSRSLLPAIEDTHYGTTSRYGFGTFFKSNYYTTAVEHVLQNIANGTPSASPRLGFSNLTEESTSLKVSPIIVCITARNVVKVQGPQQSQPKDLYDFCHSAYGLRYRESPWVILCPAFFNLPQAPPPGNCPRVNAAETQFAGSQAAFVDYQEFVLLHELLHFYLDTTRLEAAQEYHFYNWNAVLGLSPEVSVRNPMNYEFYVASKSPYISILEQGASKIVKLRY